MAAPVKFFSLKGEQTCSFKEECTHPLSKKFVYHENGISHPTHLECALKMIEKEATCTYCKRPVDGESLQKLSGREIETLKSKVMANSKWTEEELDEEAKALGALMEEEESSMKSTTGDREMAQRLQEEFDDEELARRLGNSSLEPTYNPRTKYDSIIAESLQAEEQKAQRLQNNVPPSPADIARSQGRMTCSDVAKATAAVACLAFAIGMVVQAAYGESI